MPKTELFLRCDCGWNRRGQIPAIGWLRIFLHEYRNHRKEDTQFWGQNGIVRIRRAGR